MLRVIYFRAQINPSLADALNQESGRVYTDALVRHWRVYRRHGHWLSRKAASKLQDVELGASTLLHSHSLDAAREGFYQACRTARQCRQQGLENKYPYKRKRFRPTVWKHSAIRRAGAAMLLSLARGHGLSPIRVRLPAQLRELAVEAIREVKLVYNRSGHYEFHVAVEDGRDPAANAPGEGVAAVDPGEIHPLVLTDGEETLVVTARELRAIKQYRNKQLAAIQRKQAAKVRGSRGWRRLRRAKNRLRAKSQRQIRDIEHKVSREAVEWVRARGVGRVAYGDVREVADGQRLNRKSQQKISQWAHGRLRFYFGYKAEAYGVEVVLENEAYTTRTCPGCRHEHKPRGRQYHCPVCGLRAHRDAVGAANILSRHLYGELGHIQATRPKYRQPFRKARPEREEAVSNPSLVEGSKAAQVEVWSGQEWPRRSPRDTGQVATAAGIIVPVEVGRSPSIR